MGYHVMSDIHIHCVSLNISVSSKLSTSSQRKHSKSSLQEFFKIYITLYIFLSNGGTPDLLAPS